MSSFTTNNGAKISYDAVRKAVTEPYTMDLAGAGRGYVLAAVNQGIDSHLEACFCPSLGDKYEWAGNRLKCVVSKSSLPVLLRRLYEMDTEENDGGPGLLASDMLHVLGFNESGKFVGREED